jgi:hypothetical protein
MRILVAEDDPHVGSSANASTYTGRLFLGQWRRCGRGWCMGKHRVILLYSQEAHEEEEPDVLQCFACIQMPVLPEHFSSIYAA